MVFSHLPKVRHSPMSGIIVIFSQVGIALGVSTIGFLSKNFNIAIPTLVRYKHYPPLSPLGKGG
jgi:hypothetical protein